MSNRTIQILLSAACLIFCAAIKNTAPDEPFPQGYFQMPVRAEGVRISGSFGELRPNHFHAGIDISSSTGSAGLPVFAAAAGHVHRIRVQEGGYGNVLYLKHPNGYSTVYAHLDKFTPEVARYIKEAQYKQERFEVDLYPGAATFRVKKGDQIGVMGNTGSSEGPHLHFEIRRTANQKALNPLLFGLPVQDRTPPELRDMKVYVLNEKRDVLTSRPFPVEQRPDGSFGPKAGDTVRIAAWRVGFGIKAFDQMTGNTINKNGLCTLTLLADDKVAFQWRANEMDFDESRYLNAHTDYAARQRYGAWFHRCFVLPGDRLSNYTRTESLGAIPIFKEKPTRITIKAADAHDNISTVNFWVLRDDPDPPPAPVPYQLELPSDVDSRVDMDGFYMTFPKGTLYETLFFQYAVAPARPGLYAPVHQVHDATVPLHRYGALGIRPDNLPDNLKPKAVIVRLGNGRPTNCGGIWKGNVLETRVRNFGDYSVGVDTTRPTIKPVVFVADMRRKNTMSFVLNDNLGTDGNAKGLRYRGMVDGKWILFEYDRKRARLTHHFDGRIGPGKHTLRLVVTDDRGNEAVLVRNFVR
ncbi:MAG: M23 family metallopeptidase [Lewinellaceae bacterium]|nr:M23 family metallopeptidase [Lewinellaceae bacterium]